MSPDKKSHAGRDGKVRVRMAPSPTGPFHIGSARTTLFNWLFAKRHGGTFILRIEDTDKERSKPEFEENIFESLQWLGLDWDEGPGKEEGTGARYRQSERTDIYKNYLQKLLDEKKAYYCYCTKEELEAQRQDMLARGVAPKYGGHCRTLTEPPQGKEPQTIRLKVSEQTIEFKDMIRGAVKFDTALIGDFVLAKDLETALYNFAVVIDDEEMKISHVIRGEDHISNTPKQIVIQQALGFGMPHYAHLPLILNADRSKLSKREADVALLSYRDQGFLPQAVDNFLVLMGWHPAPDAETKEEKEVWTLDELVKEFDIDRVQKAGAVFNEEKLLWLNKEHIKRLTTAELEEALLPFFEARTLALGSRERLHGIIDAVRDRMKVLTDFFDLAGFFFTMPDYAPDLLRWHDAPAAEARETLEAARDTLASLPEWSKDAVTAALAPLTEAKGKGQVLWPLRVALSGLQSSPDPYAIAAALGKEEGMARITNAIEKLQHASNP